MRFKVELHPDLERELRHWWPPGSADAFYRRLHEVIKDPVALSEPHHEPELSRYMLRRFRFGEKPVQIAVFRLDAVAGSIRVLTCRPFRKSGGPRSRKPSGHGAAASP